MVVVITLRHQNKDIKVCLHFFLNEGDMKRFPNVKARMSMQPMGGMSSNIDYHIVDHFFGNLYILEGNLAMYGLI